MRNTRSVSRPVTVNAAATRATTHTTVKSLSDRRTAATIPRSSPVWNMSGKACTLVDTAAMSVDQGCNRVRSPRLLPLKQQSAPSSSLRWRSLLLQPTVAMLLLFFTSPARALKCYNGTYDCFKQCVPAGVNITLDVPQPPPELCKWGTDAAYDNQYNGTVNAWNCPRSLDTCRGNVDCTPSSINTKKAKVEANWEECAPGINQCYNIFRMPQNGRYGKTVVWGFQRVHERGCYDAALHGPCQNMSLTNDGFGRACCSGNFCNAGARNTIGAVLATVVMLCALSLFMDPH